MIPPFSEHAQPLDQMPCKVYDSSCFQRPDLNSGSLFDPRLLAAFDDVGALEARIEENIQDVESPSKLLQLKEDPLLEYEEKCPPGGSESVILYTTSLRGIRKTFEDCQSIRFLLESFRIPFHERDVSMHLEFRQEMWRVLGGRVIPPKLFIKGRYIGGGDEVVGLHEQARLLQLLDNLPRHHSTSPCNACGGICFIVCYNCSGSRKISSDDVFSVQCTLCNENGLITCPMCF